MSYILLINYWRIYNSSSVLIRGTVHIRRRKNQVLSFLCCTSYNAAWAFLQQIHWSLTETGKNYQNRSTFCLSRVPLKIILSIIWLTDRLNTLKETLGIYWPQGPHVSDLSWPVNLCWPCPRLAEERHTYIVQILCNDGL